MGTLAYHHPCLANFTLAGEITCDSSRSLRARWSRNRTKACTSSRIWSYSACRSTSRPDASIASCSSTVIGPLAPVSLEEFYNVNTAHSRSGSSRSGQRCQKLSLFTKVWSGSECIGVCGFQRKVANNVSSSAILNRRDLIS